MANNKNFTSLNLKEEISNLQNYIGSAKEIEDTRRFACGLRGFEYSGDYNNSKSISLLFLKIVNELSSITKKEELDFLKKSILLNIEEKPKQAKELEKSLIDLTIEDKFLLLFVK